MKLKIEKNEMIQAMQAVMTVVPAKSMTPVLQNVKFVLSMMNSRLIGNNLETGLVTKLNCVVLEEGEFLVEGKTFYEIIKKLPDAEIEITVDGEKMELKCKRSKFHLPVLSTESFVALPEVERLQTITVPQLTLKDMLQGVLFCTDPGSTQKLLTCVHMDTVGSVLRVSALDGHRIAVRRTVLSEEPEDRVEVNIPAKTIADLLKLLSGSGDVKISLSRNHVVFNLGSVVFVSITVGGQYYNLEQMLGNAGSRIIRANRADMIEVIERAALFVREGDRKPVVFNVGEEVLNISCTSQYGSMNEDCEVQGNQAEKLRIGFNPRFVRDLLKAVDDENVQLYMENGKAPLIVKDESESYQYLVLPVALPPEEEVVTNG